MGTFRGEKYLARQLLSLEAQTHENWKVWVSDDGSDDGTLDIVKSFQVKWGADRLTLLTGPRRGFCLNYLFLVCHPAISADYYAYCDQDDIWYPDKLARSVAWISAAPSDVPALYCSRTQLVDKIEKPLRLTSLYRQPPSFENALVQNIASGNTMVFNNALRALMRVAGENPDIVYHDWWSYIVATACGGIVHYSPRPTMNYRQHNANQIGENLSLAARCRRAALVMRGRLRDWVDRNTAALAALRPYMTAGALRSLDMFCAARKRRCLPRLVETYRSGVRRQTLLGNIGLAIAAILNQL
jgi:glycosyltransferase involved in cell wall biosynthesis